LVLECTKKEDNKARAFIADLQGRNVKLESEAEVLREERRGLSVQNESLIAENAELRTSLHISPSVSSDSGAEGNSSMRSLASELGSALFSMEGAPQENCAPALSPLSIPPGHNIVQPPLNSPTTSKCHIVHIILLIFLTLFIGT
jgi:hypothetical protein